MAMRVSVLALFYTIIMSLVISMFIGCSLPDQADVEVAADIAPQAVDSAELEAVSQYNLGRQYANGEGVVQDYDRAFSLIKRAAEQGLPEAQLDLAKFYATGRGVDKNLAKTESLLNQAAEKGLVEAQVALGRFYSSRKIELQDYAAARLWFQRAASQGNTQAMEAIALMCVRGQGGVQSYEQAVEWLRLAVGGGSLGATYNLANYYMDGIGVEQDTEMGMALLKQSASLGYGYSIDYLVREAQRNNVDAQEFLCNLVVGPQFDTELWRAYRSTME